MNPQQMTDHDLLIRIDERTEEMKVELDASKERFARHDTRIRRIELWFLPVLTALSIASHKLIKWWSG
jgi:hypothetical protein